MTLTPAERAKRYRAKRRGGPPRTKREGPRVQISPAQRKMLANLEHYDEVIKYATDDGRQQRTLRALAAKGFIHLQQGSDEHDEHTYYAWPNKTTVEAD